MQIWRENLSGVSVIRNSEITIRSGLDEIRLSSLKKSQSEKELISLIALQITDLIEFIGLQGKMSAKQIFDTAEFILEKHTFFSLRGLQHCFNMIKNSEPPFDKPLYNAINGKKILKWLAEYDKIVDDFLFGEANSKIYADQFRALDRTQDNDIAKALNGVANAFSSLKNNVAALDLPNRKYNVTETEFNPKKK